MSTKAKDPSKFPSLKKVLPASITRKSVIKCHSTLTVTVFSPNAVKQALAVAL